MIQRIPSLYFTFSETHGKGVFTAADIPAGSLIEICPVIVIPPEEMERIKKTTLYDYYFIWKEDEQYGAIALGFGSLYNHDYTPNARYYVDFENDTLEIHTIRDIKAGEEVFISYNGDPTDKSLVWFEEEE